MANYQQGPLKLEMKDVVHVLVKPSQFIPSCILSMSTIDSRDIYYNRCQTVHVFRSSAMHDSDSNFNLCHVFKEALSKALFYYYPLAGRLVKHADGKVKVKFQATSAEFGVPFLEAKTNNTLSSIHYLDNTDTEIAKHLVFDPKDESYPLVFKVTKFLCGGFTIGMGMSHAMGDGVGASQFFKAIIELAKGKSEPSVIPVWERERLVGSITKQPFPPCPMNKESSTFSPFLNQTSTNVIKKYCFKVDGEMITRLKLSLMKESEKIRFTSFESLAAYMWRSKARALKLSKEGNTMLTVIVGIKRNLQDCDYSIPKGYYGNGIMDANIVLKVSELIEMPLYEIVKMIKEAKTIASSTDYVKKSIDTFETNREGGFDLIGTGALTVLTDWKYLGFLDESINFGENEVVNVVPAPCNLFGSIDPCIFTSPNKFDDPSMKGGVNIFMSLPVDAMPKFKEEIEALRFLN